MSKRKIGWSARVQLTDGLVYREQITFQDLKVFSRSVKSTGILSTVKDDIVNKFVFSFLFSVYPRERVNSVELTRITNG